MSTYFAEKAGASTPSIQPYGQFDTVTSRCVFALGTAGLQVGDHVVVNKLAPGCVLDAIEFDADQFDSNGSATLAFNLGFLGGMSGDGVGTRTNGAEFGAITNVGRAAGQVRITSLRMARLVPQNQDRDLALTVTGAAATAVVQSGTLTTDKGIWRPNAAYAVGDFVKIQGGVVMGCTTAGTSAARTDQFGQGIVRPNWNIGKGLTTNDGTVVWTCASVVLGCNLLYRPSRGQF